MAFDVGGTFIKAAVLDGSGTILPETCRTYPANAQLEREPLLQYFHEILLDQFRLAGRVTNLIGVGFSFPGPFHYEEGVCLIRGQGKFDALYGVSLRRELASRFTIKVPFLFENDCALFALGEYHSAAHRSIYITLGTGTGSAFLEDGRIVKHGPGVPENGWIYPLPCRDGIVDDWISRRGLIRLAGQQGVSIAEPLELYVLAEQGDETAKQIFSRFGRMAGEILAPIVRAYQPDEVELGGQIAKSNPYFLKELQESAGVRCVVSTATSQSVYTGIFRMFEQNRKEVEH